MSYNVRALNGLQTFFSMPNNLSHASIKFCNREYAGLISSHMYSSGSDFFDGMSKIFGSSTGDAIIACRMFPFSIDDIDSIPLYNYYPNGTIAGHTLQEILGSGAQHPVYTITSTSEYDFTNTRPMVSFGHISIPYFQGTDSFLSYEPYTRLKLYLPFANDLIELDAKRVRGKTLQILGYIDFINGDMIYYLTYYENSQYIYISHYKVHITIDSNVYGIDYKNLFKQQFNALSSLTRSAGNLDVYGTLGGVVDLVTTDITRTQSASSNVDVLANFNMPLKPTLLIYEPIVKYALNNTNYNHITGVPCEKVGTLSQFSGYTVISEVHTNSVVGATDPEINEIENLLKKGIRV